MAQGKMDIVSASWDAYAREDFEGSLAAYSDNTIWDDTLYRPDGGIHVGLDGLIKVVGTWRGTWNRYEIEIEGLIDAHGDRVVGLLREKGVGKGGGVELTNRWAVVVTVRDGAIVHTVAYPTHEQALDACGLGAEARPPGISQAVVPEADLNETEAGLVPAGPGWFVMNARDARWMDNPGRGMSLPLTGIDAHEAEALFPMLGMAIRVLEPGKPNGTYHWETEQEDFLVLAGEAVLIVEGQERRLKQWDFVHCPPETRHIFAGAGDGPCVLLCASSRRFQAEGPWGGYCADDSAESYNASSPEETQDADIAYERFDPARPTRYRDGLLPD